MTVPWSWRGPSSAGCRRPRSCSASYWARRESKDSASAGSVWSAGIAGGFTASTDGLTGDGLTDADLGLEIRASVSGRLGFDMGTYSGIFTQLDTSASGRSIRQSRRNRDHVTGTD